LGLELGDPSMIKALLCWLSFDSNAQGHYLKDLQKIAGLA
jgi:hypothetical protein